MIKNQIYLDLQEALKKKDSLKVSVLRLLLAAIKNEEIALNSKNDLTNAQMVKIINKEAKKRREAIALYRKGKRDDLADKEAQELKILDTYLPQKKNPREIKKIIREVIKKQGPKNDLSFGKVMGAVMSHLQGQAEGGLVAKLVKEELA